MFEPVTAQTQPTVWTDKSTYAVGETVTITMSYTQMIGVGYWVIVYKPDGSKFKLMFAQRTSTVKTTANQAGHWRVELWGEIIAPNSTATLLGTCTFTVTGTGTLAVYTLPVKGTVFVNGQSWGTAPQSRSVQVGSYTVSFGAVTGYVAPPSQTVQVSNGQRISVVGKYTPGFVVISFLGGFPPATYGKRIFLDITATNNYPVDVFVVVIIKDQNGVGVDVTSDYYVFPTFPPQFSSPSIVKAGKTTALKIFSHQIRAGSYMISWAAYFVADSGMTTPIATGTPKSLSIVESSAYPTITISVAKATSNVQRLQYSLSHYTDYVYWYPVDANVQNQLTISYTEEGVIGPGIAGLSNHYVFVFIPEGVGVVSYSTSSPNSFQYSLDVPFQNHDGKWYVFKFPGSQISSIGPWTTLSWQGKISFTITDPAKGKSPIYVTSSSFGEKVSNTILSEVGQDIIQKLLLGNVWDKVLLPATVASIGLDITGTLIDYEACHAWIVLDTGRS